MGQHPVLTNVLADQPLSMREITQHLSVCRNTAMKLVAAARASKKVYIAAWRSQQGRPRGGGHPTPLYAVGGMPDVPKPPPGTWGQYKKNRQARRAGHPEPYVFRNRPSADEAVRLVLRMSPYPVMWTQDDLCRLQGLQPYYARRAIRKAQTHGWLTVVVRGTRGNEPAPARFQLVKGVTPDTRPLINSVFNLGLSL